MKVKQLKAEELRAAENILKAMPELAYIFNKEGYMVAWNKNVELKLGYSGEELDHKFIMEFIDEEYHQIVQQEVQNVYELGDERIVEYKLIHKTGRRIPYVGSGRVLEIDGEEFLVGIAIDSTRLKETEEKLKATIEEINALKDKLNAENIYLRKEIKKDLHFEEIIGESEPLIHAQFRVKQVASVNSTVLLEGETGTGKELFARAIHNLSPRQNKAFVKVNCAALPASLIESELFGHEKGAFTGAVQKQSGRFELAHQGTIFLDEIGELPLELQPKLLRVLQEGEFERIGNPKTIKVDVRVIAATNRNLESDTHQGLFRKDLYYRLKVYPITIAPLRERKSDIPLLTDYFLKIFNEKLNKCITRIHAKTRKMLENYSWPGNIRELENVIERAVIISPGPYLLVEPLQHQEKDETSEWLPLADYERNYIIEVLEKTYWRVEGPEGAARILDMHPETLRSRMRKLGIRRPRS